ncbi:hypothetical protein KP509_32G072200 [Ceratopteris richardii]|uniref:Magnesium-dependent phosphatase 1 n=1 Tax=Ceratopteris richardii TaxID=49495 RepID=A0A8T2QUK9_CERRI|nr:hypothetical protein KP509_32G072200 [Ceratopteris richardii]
MRGGMTERDVTKEALGIISAASFLPRLVVFDLDYTLWPFYCECSSKRETPYLYPEAKSILNALKKKDVKMAVASRTPTPEIARTFLNKLGLTNLFVDLEIFPSWTHKTDHFKNIHEKTSIPFNSMLFFDDEYRNIKSVSQMGVTSVHVDDGVNIKALKKGLTDFARSQNQLTSNSS